MPEHISECNLCGGREFAVVEVLAWRGQLDESGRLSCTVGWSELESLRCADCRAAYAAGNFSAIEFE